MEDQEEFHFCPDHRGFREIKAAGIAIIKSYQLVGWFLGNVFKS